jgi:glycosyltransferase involved in cell wall biosynthesis
MTPELSIIIPTHAEGRAERARRMVRIERLAKSISAQLNPPRWEALIVANRSDPDLRERIMTFGALQGECHYHETGTVGANAARNLGLSRARGRWVLFFDDDCIATDPSLLRRHAGLHLAYPAIMGFGGPYELPAGSRRVAIAYHQKQMEWLRDAPRPSSQVDWLPGGNASFKREALLPFGFNPFLGFGATETELLLRLAADGRSVRFVEDLAVTHAADHLTLPLMLRKAFAQGAGGAWVLQQGWRARALPPISARTMPAGPLAFLGRLYDIGFRAGGRWLHRGGDSLTHSQTLRMPRRIRIGFLIGMELLANCVRMLSPARRTHSLPPLQGATALGEPPKRNSVH